MSNLGFLSVFHRLSSTDGIKVVRFFLERDGKLFSPELNTAKIYTKSESSGNLSGFDVLLFSVSFEMDYLNIVRMLKLSGIEPASHRRNNQDPLIITGGIAVTANPVPMSIISDIVYRGDMEISLFPLIELLFEKKFRKSEELLSDVSKLQGMYLKGTSLGIPGRSVKKKEISPAHSVIITNNNVFANRFLVEIARGCKNSCRFCMTRTSNFPPRSISKDEILEVSYRALKFTKMVGLIAPVVNDNPELSNIVTDLNKNSMKVSFSSLRADSFTEELAMLIKINGQKSITFAPETGSDNLRKKIGKMLKNNQILKSVELSIRYGIRNIRFYFMYGLPFEEWEDIEAINELVNNTMKIAGRRINFHLSINPFIPKLNTPFGKEKIKNLEYYRNVKKYLLRKFTHNADEKGLTLRFESLKSIYTHYYLSTGGEKTGYYLAEGSFEKSLRMIERDFLKLYNSGISPDEY